MAFERFLAIELGDEREEAIRRGVQMAPQLRDLRFELVERVLPAQLSGVKWAAQAMADLRCV